MSHLAGAWPTMNFMFADPGWGQHTFGKAPEFCAQNEKQEWPGCGQTGQHTCISSVLLPFTLGSPCTGSLGSSIQQSGRKWWPILHQLMRGQPLDYPLFSAKCFLFLTCRTWAESASGQQKQKRKWKSCAIVSMVLSVGRSHATAHPTQSLSWVKQ